jgi:hypothetical protein
MYYTHPIVHNAVYGNIGATELDEPGGGSVGAKEDAGVENWYEDE